MFAEEVRNRFDFRNVRRRTYILSVGPNIKITHKTVYLPKSTSFRPALYPSCSFNVLLRRYTAGWAVIDFWYYPLSWLRNKPAPQHLHSFRLLSPKRLRDSDTFLSVNNIYRRIRDAIFCSTADYSWNCGNAWDIPIFFPYIQKISRKLSNEMHISIL